MTAVKAVAARRRDGAGMWPYHPDLLAVPAPRYTSYPTAAEFHDGIGACDVEEALAGVAAETPVSLYVHIPFCREICWYCGCNTAAANRDARLAAYLDALDAEIDLVADRLVGRGRITRIAFGGGSPNALSPLAFVRLVDRLVTRFDAPQAELSVELDPRDLGAEWIAMLGQLGVRRASLGVQTFAPHVQRAIGRIQPGTTIDRAVAGLRAAGVTSINFDLMYGLPGQDLGDLAATLDRTLALLPERISLFGYAHVPQLLARQRRIDATRLPDARQRFDQAELGHATLVAAGYRPVGFDHFALPRDPHAIAAAAGLLHRNFQGFTDDRCDTLIGLGASAISQFPGLLAQNEKMAGRYRMLASAGQLTARRGIRRSDEDRLRGAAIERLLCDGSAQLPPELGAAMRTALAPFVDRGLVELGNGRLTLLPDALPYVRAVASRLDAYRPQSAGRFSNAI